MSILIILSTLISCILSDKNETLSPTMEPTIATVSPTVTNAILDDTIIETSSIAIATITTTDNITLIEGDVILEKLFEVDYADVVSFNYVSNSTRRRLLESSINITYIADYEFIVREQDDISDIDVVTTNVNNFIQNSTELETEIVNDIKAQISNEYNITVTDVAIQTIVIDEVEIDVAIRVPAKRKDPKIWIILVILLLVTIIVVITIKHLAFSDDDTKDDMNKSIDNNNDTNTDTTNTDTTNNTTNTTTNTTTNERTNVVEMNKVKSTEADDE